MNEEKYNECIGAVHEKNLSKIKSLVAERYDFHYTPDVSSLEVHLESPLEYTLRHWHLDINLYKFLIEECGFDLTLCKNMWEKLNGPLQKDVFLYLFDKNFFEFWASKWGTSDSVIFKLYCSRPVFFHWVETSRTIDVNIVLNFKPNVFDKQWPAQMTLFRSCVYKQREFLGSKDYYGIQFIKNHYFDSVDPCFDILTSYKVSKPISTLVKKRLKPIISKEFDPNISEIILGFIF